MFMLISFLWGNPPARPEDVGRKLFSTIAKTLEESIDSEDGEDSTENNPKEYVEKAPPKSAAAASKMEQEIQTFELGRVLLRHFPNLNKHWIAYMLKHTSSSNSLENWILSRAPLVLALRECARSSKQQVDFYANEGDKIACCSCFPNDVSEDLLTTSSDINLQQLHKVNAYHLIISHGPSLYEPKDSQLTNFYRRLRKALKPGGILITSFMTPHRDWENYEEEDMKKQNIFINKTIRSKGLHFRSEIQIRKQLTQAGFKVLKVIYDTQHIFPLIVARALSIQEYEDEI
jgi:hypothetical protein